jgi:hypothetical protein
MSKRQRPCDFCRSRKTACQIDGHVPCRLCTFHGRQCTFVEAAQPRKRPMAHRGEIPTAESGPSTFQITPGPMSDQSPFNHNAAVQDSLIAIENQDFMSDTPSQNLLLESLAGQFFSEFGGIPPDLQYGQTSPTLEEEFSPAGSAARTEMRKSSQWANSWSRDTELDYHDRLNPQALGNSGDMDPYLLRNYQYDHLGGFRFKQLTIQSVCQGSLPTQFLLSQPGLFSSSREEMGLHQTSYDMLRKELESIVSADTGTRLVALFRRFIFPQYPVFSESLFPEPQSSPPFLLAAIYMVAQPFAKFDDVLSIELAYETLNNPALFKLINQALQYESHNPGCLWCKQFCYL